MSFLDSIKKGTLVRPRRTVIYGEGGIGKTTWASKAPEAVIIPTEDGSADIDCYRPPATLTNAADTLAMVHELAHSEAEHPFKTAVLDSVDWFDIFVKKDLKYEGFDCDYGKGEVEAANRLKMLLDALNACRNRGMNVIVIAHAAITKFESPEGDSWQYFKPKLGKQACELLIEWADEVFFAKEETFTVEKEGDFGKKRNIGVSSGERILCTARKPGFIAKNRLPGLPERLSMDRFTDYASHVPYLSEWATEAMKAEAGF